MVHHRKNDRKPEMTSVLVQCSMFLCNAMGLLQYERHMSIRIGSQSEHMALGERTVLHTVIDQRQDPTTTQSASSLQDSMHETDLGFRRSTLQDPTSHR